MRTIIAIMTVAVSTTFLAPQLSAAPATELPPAKSTAPSDAPCRLQGELAEVYRDYQKAVRSGDLDEILKFVSREKREEMKGMLTNADESQKAMLMKMIQAVIPADYTVTGSTLSSDGSSATLTLKGRIDFMGNPAQGDGTVFFSKEDGKWRIKKESWRSKE